MADEQRELSLEEALASEPATGDTPKVVEEVVEEVVKATEETTEETTEESSTPEEPPEEKPKDEPWHLKAVLDEREKRQAAQKRAEELENRLKELQEPEKKTSVFEDENKFRDEFLTEIQQTYVNDKLNMSQALAEREFGKDVVSQKLEEFQKMAADNPDLTKRIMESPLPYHELVDIVNKHEEVKAMENLDEYREKIRAEERAKLEKELADKSEEKSKTRESITPSLASTRSAGGTESPENLLTVGDIFES